MKTDVEILIKGWWWKKYFSKYRFQKFLLQKRVDKWAEKNLDKVIDEAIEIYCDNLHKELDERIEEAEKIINIKRQL